MSTPSQKSGRIDEARVAEFVDLAKAAGTRWFSSSAFDRRWQIGRVSIRAHMRRNDGFMGRFGGGWNWKLGIQVGSTTAIVSLLVMELRFSLLPRQGGDEK